MSRSLRGSDQNTQTRSSDPACHESRLPLLELRDTGVAACERRYEHQHAHVMRDVGRGFCCLAQRLPVSESQLNADCHTYVRRHTMGVRAERNSTRGRRGRCCRRIARPHSASPGVVPGLQVASMWAGWRQYEVWRCISRRSRGRTGSRLCQQRFHQGSRLRQRQLVIG